MNFITSRKEALDILENYIEKLISNIRFKEVPDLIKGKTGYTNNVGVKIFYEDLCLCKNPKATILLINGSSETLIQWPSQSINSSLNLSRDIKCIQ